MEAARKVAIPGTFALLALGWLTSAGIALTPAMGIGQFLTGSWATAYAWATTIVGYLNSWWGFAAALAFAAAIGGSWIVVLIKGVLARAGAGFAIQYATWL